MNAAQLTDGDRVILSDVSWDLYRQLRSSEERRNVRMTYCEGVLEIMSPSRIHERITQLISRLVEAWATEHDMEWSSGGSTTMQREDLDRGLEPGNSYYVQHVDQMLERDDLDLQIDPPPDLVIEVDITSSSRGRLPIYARLGVPEVWRCNGHTLKFYQRSEQGDYQEISASITFPGLEPGVMMRFVDLRFDFGEKSLITLFQGWMRTGTLPDAVR